MCRTAWANDPWKPVGNYAEPNLFGKIPIAEYLPILF
jgi:hypothetical protein